MRATFLLILVSVVLFVIAAKAHGRELRLEREANGVTHVVFGGQNPPAVEAIWSAERRRFWVLAPVLAGALALVLRRFGGGAGLMALGALAWAPVIAFIALGLASAARTGVSARGHLTGSIGWWTFVLALSAVTVAVARTSATSAAEALAS